MNHGKKQLMSEANKSRKNGSNIHPSSIQKGTGSGNLYNHVPKNAVDKQDVKSHGKYGI